MEEFLPKCVHFDVAKSTIEALFSTYGTVEKVNLITDRDTGRLKGFGFVEMSSGAQKAMSSLNQSELDGRTITVNPARPREERPQQSRRW